MYSKTVWRLSVFAELVSEGWLDARGKRRFPNPEENAHNLQQIAEHAYRLPEEWATVINDITSPNLRQIAFLENLLRRIDTSISAQMEEVPHTFETIPGIGLVLQPVSSLK